jgi:hypothetical protein
MNLSIHWGPLLFAWDATPENQLVGWIAFALIAGAGLPFPICRKPWAALLAILGIVAWLVLGVIGSGINV